MKNSVKLTIIQYRDNDILASNTLFPHWENIVVIASKCAVCVVLKNSVKYVLIIVLITQLKSSYSTILCVKSMGRRTYQCDF